MRALSFLVPFLNLLSNISFIYRGLAIVFCASFFMDAVKDIAFMASYNKAEPMTIEELQALPISDIPRYLKLKDVTLLSTGYVAVENEETGQIQSASYPVYSIEQSQAVRFDSVTGADLTSIQCHVIVKDNAFSEDAFAMLQDVDGKYDNTSFEEEKKLMEGGGIAISDKAILIVKEAPPAAGNTWLIAIGTGLISLLGLLSFVPNRFFGVEDVYEEEKEEEQA